MKSGGSPPAKLDQPLPNPQVAPDEIPHDPCQPEAVKEYFAAKEKVDRIRIVGCKKEVRQEMSFEEVDAIVQQYRRDPISDTALPSLRPPSRAAEREAVDREFQQRRVYIDAPMLSRNSTGMVGM